MAHPVHIDPARVPSRIRPLKAWSHMRKLIADKEDTEQVFHIIQALNGNNARKDFMRFMAKDSGPAILAKRQFLPDMLDNHAPLKALPEGTVGRAYVAFMEREGLTAHGLVEESRKHADLQDDFEDDLQFYVERLRDTHDLYHVLTGYGRDALGEASLLRYTHSQHGGLGISFIAFMGHHQIAKHVPRTAGIKQVMDEARNNGKAAQRIIDQDIEALLREPIDAARARMNIAKPVRYREALRVIADHGIEPALVAA